MGGGGGAFKYMYRCVSARLTVVEFSLHLCYRRMALNQNILDPY